MRLRGLLPVILVFIMVLIVCFGYSQGHAVIHAKAIAHETPWDGFLFLFLSAAVVYGGPVLYRKD